MSEEYRQILLNAVRRIGRVEIAGVGDLQMFPLVLGEATDHPDPAVRE